MRGIPRQAVWARSKVLGTELDASVIVDTLTPCPWLNHMWGVDVNKRGGQEYYNSIIDLYASWGVDYIKMDDANLDHYYRSEVEAVHKAIERCGRPIVLSLSPGQQFKYHENMVQNANAYRISFDFWDNWKQLKRQFDYCQLWAPISGPGHWPDADMLQIGRISKRGPEGIERSSHLTEDEQITHITLWSIFQSPLMMGGNMPENTPFVASLLTNGEVLAVDQDSHDSRQLSRQDSTVVWVSQVNDSKDWNVAFFNLDDVEREVSIVFPAIGIRKKCKVRDLWKKQDLGVFKGVYKQKIPPHGAALFRVTPS
jgi:alpha-galactosidase